MQKQRKGILKVIFTMFLLACSIFSNLFTSVNNLAFALSGNAIEYTDVLADLQKDENFNLEDYPIDNEDFSLKVIQIAESVNKELFIYVYQPSIEITEFEINGINLSTEESNTDDFKTDTYKLILLNRNGVFSKYKVQNFTINNILTTRQYNITEIFRNFDEIVDKQPDSDSPITERAIKVGQLWLATTVDNVIYYSCQKSEVVEITDKYVSFIRYTPGFGYNGTDRYFLAFNSNYNIEELYEIDLIFNTKTLKIGWDKISDVVEDPPRGYSSNQVLESSTASHGPITYKYTESAVVTYRPFIRKKTFKFDRISTASKFLEDNANNLSDKKKDGIKGMQYVLNFYESPHTLDIFGGPVRGYYVHENRTIVQNVAMLRLKFYADGKVYNLGVVDNKQNSSLTPSGYFKAPLPKWVKYVFYGILAILSLVGVTLLSIFAPWFRAIFVILGKAIWFVFKNLCKGILFALKYLGIGIWYCIKYTGLGIWQGLKALWWFISYPFKIIKGQV